MPYRKTTFERGIAYHVFNRWINKQTIFFSDSDFARFCTTVEHYLETFIWVHMISYCLLPNHFHFVLVADDQARGWIAADFISNFVGRIQQSYATYLSRKFPEKFPKWPVFEWRFRAKTITDEGYLSQIQAYVNYNAVRHGIVENIKDWSWTSAHELLWTWWGFRKELPSISFPNDFPEIQKEDIIRHMDTRIQNGEFDRNLDNSSPGSKHSEFYV